MRLKLTTPVPNQLFDVHLKNMKECETKVLLVVIRQTLGWIDPSTGQRKKYDWISNSQFAKKAGLSSKSVTSGIDGLVRKRLIVAFDQSGFLLSKPEDRRHADRIFYTLGNELFDGVKNIL